MRLPAIKLTTSQPRAARMREAQSEISTSIIPEKPRKYSRISRLQACTAEHKKFVLRHSTSVARGSWLRFFKSPTQQPRSHQVLGSFLRISRLHPQGPSLESLMTHGAILPRISPLKSN